MMTRVWRLEVGNERGFVAFNCGVRRHRISGFGRVFE